MIILFFGRIWVWIAGKCKFFLRNTENVNSFYETFKFPQMISQEILALILEQIDFADDTLEGLVEAQTTAAVNATAAAIKFESVAADAELDPEQITELAGNVVKLASKIGTAFPTLSQGQADEFKALFEGVFDQPVEELEVAGEDLFDAAIDNVIAIKGLVSYVAGQQGA
jgi:hypothetical protein